MLNGFNARVIIQTENIEFMLRLHGHVLPHFFCIDPTYFIRVCKCTAQFSRRAFTPTHFPIGKANIMSAFRHIRRDAENASESVHSHWQIFCVAENAL